jgi:glycosyltransferase involved in cell wall biosynthesis
MVDFSKSTRRIGILTYDYDPSIGGLGVLVKTYVQELTRLCPEDVFTVISPADNADDHGSPWGRARYGKSGGCPLFSLSLLWSLPALVRKHRLQILHVHAGSGGIFLFRRPACPLVVTAHHTYLQEADIVYKNNPVKKLWKMFMALLESRTYYLADTVICVSRDTADEIITRYGVSARKVCVVENPVRIDDLPALKDIQKTKDTILFVGRLEPRKGILMLLEAFEIVRKDMPSAKLRLIGLNLLGKKLDAVIQSRGLTDAVTTLGYVHNPYRMREMAQATMLVVPSTLEGFGLVAAEAMVLGTVVVASDAPGLRTIVSDGKTGLTFRVGDAASCAKQILKILRDPAFRQSLEGSAAAEAPERFDVEKRTRDQMEMYDQFLN